MTRKRKSVLYLNVTELSAKLFYWINKTKLHILNYKNVNTSIATAWRIKRDFGRLQFPRLHGIFSWISIISETTTSDLNWRTSKQVRHYVRTRLILIINKLVHFRNVDILLMRLLYDGRGHHPVGVVIFISFSCCHFILFPGSFACLIFNLHYNYVKRCFKALKSLPR